MRRTLAAVLATVTVSSVLAQGAVPAGSVGEIVLLATRPSPESAARLRTALSDGDPRVRLAAARVVSATSARELWSPVSQALFVEQDPAPAAEQIRAMLHLQGARAVPLIEAHAVRLGGPAARSLADWLALHDVAGLVARLPSLAGRVAPGVDSLRAAVTRAAADPASRHDVLTAWAAVASGEEWKMTLQSVLRFDADIQTAEATLIEALRSAREPIRQDTAWFMLEALAAGHSLPRPLLAAVERPDVVTGWESFGRELLVRYGRRADPVDAASFLARVPAVHRMRSMGRLQLLSPNEQDVMKRRDPSLLGAPPRPMASGQLPTVRSVQLWMRGLIDDLASAAGCSLPPVAVTGVARVTHHADGRPGKIEAATDKLSPSCVPVFHALLMTSISEVDRPVSQDQQLLYVLPLSQRFAQCTGRAFGALRRVGGEHGSGVIRTPRKTRDIKPVYPQPLMRAGRQGTVILDAVLSDTGCVRDLYVSHSAGTVGLDLAALEAVSQWEFEPTLLDGEPIAVTMTVSVNFSIR